MITTIATVVVALISIFLLYYKWALQYWNRKGLNNLPGTIPFGSLGNPAKSQETMGVVFKHIYQQMRAKGWRHAGVYLFAKPMYIVLDLEYVKNVLTKNFSYFVDRGLYYNEKDDPLSAHLFALGGVKWKNLRAKLSPTFSSGKIKTMFPILVDCVQPLIQAVDEQVSPVNIKDIVICFTTDIIGSCGFGLECNSFKEPNSPLMLNGKKVLWLNKFEQLKLAFASSFNGIARFLRITFFSKNTRDFFFGIVRKTVDYRQRNNIRRNDFMQLLIDMKNENEKEYNHDGTTLTFEEIVAQAFVFFLAGFETTSTTIAFALYEMAANQDIHDKAREEVIRVLTENDGQITYESLNDLKYMQQVIDETLRKYPPLPFLTRECVQDYKVPDEDLVIEKGTRVGISIIGIHHDPEYYPEPEKFDPERFSDENKRKRNQYAYFPFGEGPRLCIGQRFSLIQIKVALVALLKSYKFTVHEKTREPIEFDMESFVLAAKGDIWLNANKI